MTNTEFKEWENNLHCVLFGVMPTDLDDEHQVRLDQLKVLQFIVDEPQVLKHRTLRELLEYYQVLDEEND